MIRNPLGTLDRWCVTSGMHLVCVLVSGSAVASTVTPIGVSALQEHWNEEIQCKLWVKVRDRARHGTPPHALQLLQSRQKGLIQNITGQNTEALSSSSTKGRASRGLHWESGRLRLPQCVSCSTCSNEHWSLSILKIYK